MWLFTKDGFYSIVHKDCEKDELTVRARVKKDLEKMLKKVGVKAVIHDWSGSDYRFRVVMKRADFVRYMVDYGENLQYDNFKNTIPHDDVVRHEAYFGVWSAGMQLQRGRGDHFWP